MNELIKELAAKAGINGLARLDGTFENEAEVKKFAELIVQECVNVLHDNELHNRHISHVLREHFGVEE